MPKTHDLFKAIEEYYPCFGKNASRAWLTNKPSHTDRRITEEDLEKYFAVLEGDLMQFNGNFCEMEACKDCFCTGKIADKRYYCNCQILCERLHCPSTIFIMDLQNEHGRVFTDSSVRHH